MNLVVVSKARQTLRDICANLDAMEEPIEVTPIEGSLDDLAKIPAHQDPEVMILDCSGGSCAPLERIEQLRQLYPDMALILVTDNAAPDFLMGAMRAGVREVLPLPATTPVLASALGRLVTKANGHERRHGQILTFVGCKGGAGTSFLAANLGYVLAEHEQKVLLLDLNLQFGDAALFVSDQKSTKTIADLAEEIHRVDAAFLASSVVHISEGFDVLAAPEDPSRALAVKAEHVDTLLRLARHQYDFVVIDAGRGLDAVSLRALDHADVIYPVLQLTLPFIRDAKRLVEAFRSLDYGREKVRIIVNRYQKSDDIGLADVQKALGYEAAHVVPNQFEPVAASVNQGVPVRKLAPASLVSKALVDIAATLTSAETRVEPAGWFGRLLGR
ncbi:MAG: AAA family ATPase [Rhodocyclales bacterium]|nr:AAA family ATPase [Rhodocyclales bacterium]